MHKFQAHSTLKEIEIMGMDALGCVNPAVGRLLLDSMLVRSVLEKMSKCGEKLVCMSFLDKGKVAEERKPMREHPFVCEFTIITDKDKHSCPNSEECLKETGKLLRRLNLESIAVDWDVWKA